MPSAGTKQLYRCPVCLAPLGRITIGSTRDDRLFTSLPGITVCEREGQRFEVICTDCGAAHRFIGADRVIRFRIIQ